MKHCNEFSTSSITDLEGDWKLIKVSLKKVNMVIEQTSIPYPDADLKLKSERMPSFQRYSKILTLFLVIQRNVYFEENVNSLKHFPIWKKRFIQNIIHWNRFRC